MSVTTSPVLHRYLFVASPGGHLTELNLIAARLPASPTSLWITSESPQSRSLLREKNVVYVPYVKGRDPLGVLKVLMASVRPLWREDFEEVISTGSALAIGVFLVCAFKRVPRTFIESVARIKGPSLTGKITARLRLATCYTQSGRWSGRQWYPYPLLLNDYHRVRRVGEPLCHPRLFVTLGTYRGYRFDRLIDAVLGTGLATETTRWQLGQTSRHGLPGEVFSEVGTADFLRFISDSDVLITHAGVGTLLTALHAGVPCVIVPRLAAMNEHVDDHQLEIAEVVTKRGLAAVLSAESMSAADILEAAQWRVARGVSQ